MLIFQKLQPVLRFLSTISIKAYKKYNLKRWENENNLLIKWNDRTEKIAQLIPDNCSVLEFGAGKQYLKSLLQDSCTYTPSDLIYRGEGTIICDLNSTNLKYFEYYDVIVFSGVLEYVYDVPRLIKHLEKTCKIFIVSYASIEKTNKFNIIKRRTKGWVNDYNTERFKKIFLDHGFVCSKEVKWRKQSIFKFIN